MKKYQTVTVAIKPSRWELSPWPCRVLLVFLFIVIVSTYSEISGADSFRCSGKVISTGDSRATVLQKCGEPRSMDRGSENIRIPGGQKEVRVERWHYKKSSRSLGRVVMIYKGKVVAIETGER
jgi:hypothetical protein